MSWRQNRRAGVPSATSRVALHPVDSDFHIRPDPTLRPRFLCCPGDSSLQHVLRPSSRILTLLLVCLALATPGAAQRGALVRPANLQQLVNQSAVILRGHVVSAHVEPHPDLQKVMTVVVTLKVQETLKGQAGQTFTFRQFIWEFRDIQDAAGYKKGQELLLLMNPPTRYGLSSPAGLEQGRFRIIQQQGERYAVNGHGNAGLFRSLESRFAQKRVQLPPTLAAVVSQQRPGPLRLDDLKDLIRQVSTLGRE